MRQLPLRHPLKRRRRRNHQRRRRFHADRSRIASHSSRRENPRVVNDCASELEKLSSSHRPALPLSAVIRRCVCFFLFFWLFPLVLRSTVALWLLPPLSPVLAPLVSLDPSSSSFRRLRRSVHGNPSRLPPCCILSPLPCPPLLSRLLCRALILRLAQKPKFSKITGLQDLCTIAKERSSISSIRTRDSAERSSSSIYIACARDKLKGACAQGACTCPGQDRDREVHELEREIQQILCAMCVRNELAAMTKQKEKRRAKEMEAQRRRQSQHERVLVSRVAVVCFGALYACAAGA